MTQERRKDQAGKWLNAVQIIVITALFGLFVKALWAQSQRNSDDIGELKPKVAVVENDIKYIKESQKRQESKIDDIYRIVSGRGK